MEIWTVHDINGDGSPDFFVRHKLPNDPTGFTGIFLVLFMGLFVISFFFFASFDDKEGSNLMGTGIMSVLGSATVAGLLAGRLCGLLRVSYYVPLGALGGFIVLGFVMVGAQSAARTSTEAAKRQAEQAESDRMAKVRQKQEANDSRGRPVLLMATAAARARGWKMNDTHSYCYTTGYGEKSHTWRSVADVPDTIFYQFQGNSPAPRDQFMHIRYEESTRKWTVSAMGSDKDFSIRDAYHELHEDSIISDYWHIRDAPLEAIKPGLLKDLANELAGYLHQQIVADEMARRQESERQAAASAAATQQKAEVNSGSRSGWMIGALIVSVNLGGTGAFLVWKGRRNRDPISAAPDATPRPADETRYRYSCSGCRARYQLPHGMLGKSFRCKRCKSSCTVPMDVEHLAAE